MSKEIIVNADKRESRIAVREDGILSELHIEREERVVGSIYMAKVESVHHGMDASFVDIGLDRNAFLYVGDIIPGGGADDEEGSEGGGFDRRGRRSRPTATIGQLVKRGQQLLVAGRQRTARQQGRARLDAHLPAGPIPCFHAR